MEINLIINLLESNQTKNISILLILIFNLLINCVSAKSTPEILSLNGE